MAAKVIWSPSSLDDLGAVIAFIAADNPPAANEIGEGILAQIRKIGDFPRIGKPFAHSPQGKIRELVFDKYRLLYRLSANERDVTMLRIWHGARGNPSL